MIKYKKVLLILMMILFTIQLTNCYPTPSPDYSDSKIIPVMDNEEVYTEGNGYENDSFIIDTKGKLIYLSNQINRGINSEAYYELTTNIDLQETEWIAIGTMYYRGFKGHFNGNGYEISNYKITKRHKNSNAEHVGLFGYNEGTIEKLGVTNFIIDMKHLSGISMSTYAGGVAGANYGIIRNVYAIGKIDLNYRGVNENNNAPGSIYGAGITTYGKYGITSNCYACVDVNIEHNNEHLKASIAGLVVGSNVENSFYTGSISIIPDGVHYHDCPTSIGENDPINCYRFDHEEYYIQGNTCTSENLNTLDFYINKLKWSEDIWDLSNVSFKEGKFEEGKYPKIKQIKGKK